MELTINIEHPICQIQTRRKKGGREGSRTDRGESSWSPEVLFFFLLGSTVTAEIQGVIDACVKLTGMPDLTLSFMVMSIAHLLGMGKEVFLERMKTS